MKKKVWIWIGIIAGILIFLAVGATIVMKMGSKVVDGMEEEDMSLTVQKADKQELTESILVTGQIVPESEQKVYAEPENGEIQEFKVEENKKVKKGDPLFVYDSSKLSREFDKTVRERDLVNKRAQIEINQIAELNKRIKEAKQKVGRKIDPEAEVAEEAVTQDDVNQLENEKVQAEMDHEATKEEIQSIQETINELDAQIKAMTVVSKIDGIVVKVNKNVEKTETGSTEPVVHIISSQPYKVIGTMNEFDAVKIAKDQPVVIRPKVFKDREWKGVVESVSQFPTDDGGGGEDYEMMGGGGNVTTYPFKVAITDDTTELRQGFHVSLEVKMGGGEKSLVVPHMAIVEEEDVDENGESSGEMVEVIYVLVDGVLQRREIETGKMNDEFIEITEGVTKDELVVISPSPGLHDGMEVTSYDEVE
ncbi:HlyD family efflux transporter periplasmic adaptor subunit [Lederbergia sp. NSJ-179]|uniref:efflux RND transporter periplasmic adaptor subunit n=1 Tax=Lederbergia sp. NSJ-179 TaxID=2931402 RepID=UPI001FCF8924|nr:biotin/lipoyl-binding protein [Lederbergia sp. NSJ-179]MCJ7841049.1 HlyD family efflux transporter periplasmic adaptor subunit [Lederbergia sp. NSJ-179]